MTMLYIRMSAEGHSNGYEFFSTTITPILGDKPLINGCYDYSLSIQQETQNEIFKLCKDNNSVWIITQDNVIPWRNPVTGSRGCSKGGVTIHRLHDTDIVIYELPQNSWFVSDKIIYHNDGGVLIRYEADSIIGWETWRGIPQYFHKQDALEFRVNE